MKNILFRSTFLLCFLFASVSQAQKTEKFNLSKQLADGKLVYVSDQNVTIMTDGSKQGISCTGIVWLKGTNFSTGSIDIDLKGKDVFQQSFLGIAFHGIDTGTYESIYFRPFNFQSSDALRKKHTVQYICQPDFPWERLRKEHPLVYENAVIPSLQPTEWFHAHIVVEKDEITVYVNHSDIPSLKVKKLNIQNDGLIGLWDVGLNGDFANMVVTHTN